ncbi:hypothetical protein B9Z55_018005 [Caenorhabditis nigoni]|uniref:Uncharacterized protein n=1 Tax=Caenorhabditis nigoni TaxID=1611254 RepID=A0A2G5TCP1_9PELO|nr:hypothetical protein B9Z55_018005 [Caenorhabditis nigoni]
MGLKKDREDEARVLENAERQAQEQRQRELDAFRDDSIRQGAERTTQQRREDERMEKEDKRLDVNLKTCLDHLTKTQENNRLRVDQLVQAQEQNIKDVMKEGIDALDRQRNFNQAEIKNRTTDHQNMILRTEGKIAETEKKTEDRVEALKVKKEEVQNMLNEDRKENHEKELEVKKQHFSEMEKHRQELANLELTRQENEIAHEHRMVAIEASFQTTRATVAIAGMNDVIESNFCDSVSNTRAAALEVSKLVNSLEKNAMELLRGNSESRKTLTAIKTAHDRLVLELENLQTSASRIREQHERNNPSVEECLDKANQICELIRTFTRSLNEFMGSLHDNPTQESRDLFETVQTKHSDLQQLVDSLPGTIKSQHTIGALTQAIQSFRIEGYQAILE